MHDGCGSRAGGEFDIYSCPRCGADLQFAPSRDDPSNGELRCPSAHSYPVISGLPRFVHDEGYCSTFGYQWRRHDLTQLDSTTHTSMTRARFFAGTGWPEDLSGERILEAGCGSGRFTEVLLSTKGEVFSFDYSRAAEVALARFGPRGVHVCQASIYEMPYTRASFDRVFCYGVLQHCPDVKTAFLKLVEMVKTGGYLAVDVYDWRKLFLHSRYRVRWLTRRMDHESLYRWCRCLVPAYMRLVPPLHPWNLLLVPIKDYRRVLPGLSDEQVLEWSILDTFDFLSPKYDKPQSLRTMKRWCTEAGLAEVQIRRGGNGIEVCARRPPNPF